MPKLPTCNRCLYCAHDHHLVCAVHPTGPVGAICPDFALAPELEGKQFRDFLGLEPELEAYELDYDIERELQSSQIPSNEEQIWWLKRIAASYPFALVQWLGYMNVEDIQQEPTELNRESIRSDAVYFLPQLGRILQIEFQTEPQSNRQLT